MSSIGTYVAMGGYAVFVWPAYGLTVAVLGSVAAWSWRRYRQSLLTLERLQAQAGARR